MTMVVHLVGKDEAAKLAPPPALEGDDATLQRLRIAIAYNDETTFDTLLFEYSSMELEQDIYQYGTIEILDTFLRYPNVETESITFNNVHTRLDMISCISRNLPEVNYARRLVEMAIKQSDIDFARAMGPHIQLYDKLRKVFKHSTPEMVKLVVPYLKPKLALFKVMRTNDPDYVEMVMLQFPDIDKKMYEWSINYAKIDYHFPMVAMLMRNPYFSINPAYGEFMVDYRWDMPENIWMFPAKFVDLASVIARFIDKCGGDSKYNKTFAELKQNLFLIVREKAWVFDSYGTHVLGESVQRTSTGSLQPKDELVMVLRNRRLAPVILDRVGVKCRTFSCRVALDILSNEYDELIMNKVVSVSPAIRRPPQVK
ncbi:hypothetical protein SARC_01579 [Sphaeroforma arctica JP610]|uniref:Uncharacterized protein n=1 Tax=Sphaeroforma arctica JP610 TaxID=667725 RepID=A0A0L0GB60_9EUKA|nr:hypothetical protein SARC_01579 [Sphaeroforma arctica JP610]KNC86257.1 hypothetical protein SARC_01579 [Sphaeroforma arctica JP610]|eukprot:XP_014160159.1 hypothetical protein SARC_01579 [Sphaeroforma arctica JP610]